MSGSFGILFYSNNCKYSQNLKKIMLDQDLLKFFTQKCIDSCSTDEIAKIGIQYVPTLIIFNGNGTKKIYENQQAFAWLEEIILSRRENMCKVADNTRRLIQQNNLKTKYQDGLHDHDPLETGGISDSYAYWSNDLQKDIDIPQPKNFLPFKQDEQYGIITLTDNKNSKLSSNEQINKMKDIENIRTQQDTSIKKVYENSHLQTVLQNEINGIK